MRCGVVRGRLHIVFVPWLLAKSNANVAVCYVELRTPAANQVSNRYREREKERDMQTDRQTDRHTRREKAYTARLSVCAPWTASTAGAHYARQAGPADVQLAGGQPACTQRNAAQQLPATRH